MTNPPPRKYVIASVTGNALEWYDFFLFGAASALVFGKLFFPSESGPTVSLLASFAAYAVGFAARPLGGLIFGHVGDRYGRTVSLLWTLSLMGLATFAMGLLPTYEAIGVWAPIALVLLRIVQGIAAGGEWGGGVLLVTENAPSHRRGFLGAWSQTGVGLGFVLASLAFYFAQQLPEEDFLTWGWRVPFLLSIFVVAVGFYIRRKIPDSVVHQPDAKTALPVVTLLRRYPREITAAIGVRLAETGGSHLLLPFALAYGQAVGVDVSTMLLATTIGMLADSLMMPVFGALSDKFGRRTVYIFGAVSLALFAYPFFLLLGSGSPALVIVAFVVGNGICHAAMIGVQPALFSELFSADVRYSGLSFAHEISSVVVSGVPLLAVSLFALYGSILPVILLVLLLCLLTVISCACLPKPRGFQAEPNS